MTEEEKSKIYRICYDSKQGSSPSPEESQFLQKMFKKHPKEYRLVSREAAEAAIRDYTDMFGGGK